MDWIGGDDQEANCIGGFVKIATRIDAQHKLHKYATAVLFVLAADKRHSPARRPAPIGPLSIGPQSLADDLLLVGRVCVCTCRYGEQIRRQLPRDPTAQPEPEAIKADWTVIPKLDPAKTRSFLPAIRPAPTGPLVASPAPSAAPTPARTSAKAAPAAATKSPQPPALSRAQTDAALSPPLPPHSDRSAAAVPPLPARAARAAESPQPADASNRPQRTLPQRPVPQRAQSLLLQAPAGASAAVTSAAQSPPVASAVEVAVVVAAAGMPSVPPEAPPPPPPVSVRPGTNLPDLSASPGRGDLLASIRKGTRLRKVTDQSPAPKSTLPPPPAAAVAPADSLMSSLASALSARRNKLVTNLAANPFGDDDDSGEWD